MKFVSFIKEMKQYEKEKMLLISIFSFSRNVFKNKRAMMALYRSTGWYVKSIHTKHYITWEMV